MAQQKDPLFRVKELEELAFLGDLDARKEYAVALECERDFLKAREVYCQILCEHQDDTIAKEGFIRTGGPWIEFEPKDRKGFVRLWNVCHQGKMDSRPHLYHIDWCLHRFGNGLFLTQAQAALRHDIKDGDLADAAEYNNSVMMVEKVLQLRVQQKEVQCVQEELFIPDFKEGVLTGTRYVHNKRIGDEKIIHNYHRFDQYIESLHVTGPSGHMNELNDGPQIAIATLGDTIEHIDRVYSQLFGEKQNTYLLRLNENQFSENNERPVILIERDKGLCIGAGIGVKTHLQARGIFKKAPLSFQDIRTWKVR